MSLALPVHKITVVGVGLIGGSFAKGIKQSVIPVEIIGFGHNEANLQLAVELGVIDSYSLDMAEAVKDSDLIMLGVPLGAMQSSLEAMRPHLKPGAIISDVGSAKMSVIEAVRTVFGELPARFVAGHPIAGKEKSGVSAADAGLFVKHRVILTPTAETEQAALETVRALWQLLGADVIEMAPDYHDEVLAATSHLPHMLAFGLVEMLNEHPELGNVFQYTAGGFRDFTRIASSDAVMWRDIAMSNGKAISKWLRHYQQALGHMIALIDAKDAEALYALFEEAKTARDTHILKKTD